MPLQLAAAPTIARFVVVALVVEAFVENRLVKLLKALQKFCVVVESPLEIVIAPVEPLTIAGYVAARLVTPPAPVPQSLPVPLTTPEVFTCKHCVEPVIPESVSVLAIEAPPLNVRRVEVALPING